MTREDFQAATAAERKACAELVRGFIGPEKKPLSDEQHAFVTATLELAADAILARDGDMFASLFGSLWE